MNRKMKVALEDIKYIQTEIEKILNLSRNSNSPNRTNHNFMKETLTSQTKRGESPLSSRVITQENQSPMRRRNAIIPPLSPNKFKRRSTSSQGKAKSKNKRESISIEKEGLSPKRIVQKVTPDKKKETVKKVKVKKQTGDKKLEADKKENFDRKGEGDKKRAEDVKDRRNSKSSFNSNKSNSSQEKREPISRSQQFRLRLTEVAEEHNESNMAITPSSNKTKPIKLQENENMKNIIKKWTIHDQNTPNSNHSFNIKDKLPRALTVQVPKAVIESMRKQVIFPEEKDRFSPPDSPREQRQDELPYGNFIYTTPSKQQVPHYLNSSNKHPLRSEDQFLASKYTYKTLTKKQCRQSNLKQKYHLLDQKLSKIRGQLLSQTSQTVDPLRPVKPQKQRKSQEQLKTYLRYSPLNKLLKVNQKYKISSSKHSQQSVRTKSQQKQLKILQTGRPLWLK